MVFLKNASMCIKKVKLINHDCVPILMLLYIMLYNKLTYLMLLAALSIAVCLHDVFVLLFFCYRFLQMLCLGLLTNSLFISSMIFHHALCF